MSISCLLPKAKSNCKLWGLAPKTTGTSKHCLFHCQLWEKMVMTAANRSMKDCFYIWESILGWKALRHLKGSKLSFNKNRIQISKFCWANFSRIWLLRKFSKCLHITHLSLCLKPPIGSPLSTSLKILLVKPNFRLKKIKLLSSLLLQNLATKSSFSKM